MLKLAKIIIRSFNGLFDKELTASEIGYRVQEDEVEKLLNRFKGFTTVELTDLQGRILSLPLRRGADRGIDVIFRIRANTEQGAKSVYGKVKKILLNNDY